MGAYRFSMAPNISVPRSKFKMPFNHATSFNHGKLVPIDCFEILPGDEFKCNISAIIRMSQPIAPIFGNITAHVHAFFVPMRLLWEHTKEFYGENKTAAGYQTYNYKIPSVNLKSSGVQGPKPQSVSSYLGKPLGTGTSYAYAQSSDDFFLSVLKERGYYLTWSEYYRAQQLQGPALISLGDTGTIATIQSGNDSVSTPYSADFGSPVLNVCKEFDYFTAMTTAPQYGSAVQLPLGTVAPLVTGYNLYDIGDGINNYPLRFSPDAGSLPTSGNSIMGYDSTGVVGGRDPANPDTTYTYEPVTKTNLLVDLSKATAASINTIRYAFQVQKWLERANFGSRFFEMLNLHYGVTSPDARLQRPEYLGGFDFPINIDQVVSTAGFDAGSQQEVGSTGAISVTGVRGKNLFHKAFVEPGYVYVFISTTHERSYSQGFLREDLRSERFDFYFPEFANLGDQGVKAGELFYNNGQNNTIIGYQEHWAEYRYRPNRVSGLLNPNDAMSLDFWTLAEKFTTLPTLSDAFIMENRSDLQRVLTTGSSGPDYIGDFYLDYTAVREMPLYTIPGLVDHFGTM